jgi:hypothetical protein
VAGDTCHHFFIPESAANASVKVSKCHFYRVNRSANLVVIFVLSDLPWMRLHQHLITVNQLFVQRRELVIDLARSPIIGFDHCLKYAFNSFRVVNCQQLIFVKESYNFADGLPMSFVIQC